MFILITNDDGYDAAGLWAAYDLAEKLVGKNDRIGVIAPSTEQSGTSHAMSYLSPIRFEKKREDHFTVDGTPTDCVLLALQLFDARPDLLLSGVNRGHNLGPDLLYSGTVGAAIEAAIQGIPAISLSQYYRPVNKDGADRGPADPFAPAREMGLELLRKLTRELLPNWPEGRFCNVNFPPLAGEPPKGIRFCPAEAPTRPNIEARAQLAPNHREYYWLGHPGPIKATQEASDIALCQQGYATVSICGLNLCDHEMTSAYSHLFEAR